MGLKLNIEQPSLVQFASLRAISAFTANGGFSAFKTMERGYIKLYRRIQDSEEWLLHKFDKPRAWIDLLLLAHYKDKPMLVRGIKIQVKRGEIAIAESTLAKRWQWSREKVRRFLNTLETRQQIVQQKNRVISTYLVVNYDLYQTTNETTNETTKKPLTIKEKKDNNTTLVQQFTQFWELYPRKVGKQEAFKSFKKHIHNGIFKTMITALQEQIEEKHLGSELQYYPHPTTWLNQHRWEDILKETPQPQIKQQTVMDLSKEKEKKEAEGRGN